MLHKQLKSRIGTFVWILLIMKSVGCDAPGALFRDSQTVSALENQPRAVARQAPVVPDGSPEELLALVQQSQREANILAELLFASGTNRQARMAEFTRHIDTGIVAADKLCQHSEATELQCNSARQWKLSFLYLGAKIDEAKFLPRLKSFVTEIEQQDRSPLSAAGKAFVIEIECIAADRSDSLRAIAEYARSYPEWDTGVLLFQKYGEKLERADRREDAIDCYRTGISLYAQLPATAVLKDRLARLQQTEQAKIRRIKAQQTELSQIRSQLGIGDDGYFVIFARAPEDSNVSLYAFEYEVLHGIDAATAYIYGLKPNWQWQLVQRFPDTPDDFREATNLAEQLTKKRAFISF